MVVAQTRTEAVEVFGRGWTWNSVPRQSDQDFLPDWREGVRERGGRDDAKVFGLGSWKLSQASLRGLLTSSNCPHGPVAEVKTSRREGRSPAPGSGARGMHGTYWLFHYPLFIGLIGFCHFLIVSCLERRL